MYLGETEVTITEKRLTDYYQERRDPDLIGYNFLNQHLANEAMSVKASTLTTIRMIDSAFCLSRDMDHIWYSLHRLHCQKFVHVELVLPTNSAKDLFLVLEIRSGHRIRR